MAQYIDNREFTKEVVAYVNSYRHAIQNELPVPKISESIGKAILMTAHGLASRPNFSGYSYKDLMIDEAIEDCLKALRNFDETKTNNAFAYITQCCWYAFLEVIKKEKKQSYIKAKMFYERANDLYDVQETDEDFNLESDFVPFFDVEDFEKKEEKRKLDSKTKQREKPRGLDHFMEIDDEYPEQND